MSEGDPSSNAVVPPTGERKRESVNVACQTDQVTRKGESLFNFANVQGGSSSGAAEVDDDPSGVKPNSVEKYFMAKKTGGDLSADDKKRCSTQTQSTSQKIGEPDWNDESCRLKLTIPKFSELEETMCSEGKSIQNVQWKIMVMPKQHMVQKKTQKCMGFFLQCAPENTYSDNWEVHAVADMRLLSCKAEVNHFSRRTTHTYTSKENDWGYSCFMTWADILDESQGYIKNDTVQLEIAVKSNEAKHIMKYEQFVQKIERWMQLADMQLAKGQIDLAIEANSNAINFCKDKDDKCLERLEAQKSRIVQEKLIQSISRIEKGHEVDAQPVKPQSLRLVLSGAQKSSNGKMAGKGAKKGRPVMTVKQLQKKKEQKAEIVEKQKTQIQQQHDRVREAQKKQLRTSIDAMEQQQRLFKQDSHADTERELEKVTMELRRLKDQQKSLTEAVAADGVLDDGQDNESNRTYNVDSSSGNSVCDLSQMQLSSINSDEDDYESTEAYNEGEFGGDDDVTLSDLYYNNQVPVQSQQDESQLNGLDTNNLEQNLYAMKIDDETGEASSTPAANDPRTLMVAALSTAARMTVERMPQTTGGDINEQGDIDLRDYDPDHLIQDSVDTIMNSSMFDDEKFSPSDRLLSGKNEEDIEIHDKSIQTEGEESRAAMKELIKLRQRRPAGVKDTMENLQHLQQLQHEISQQLADSYHPYTFIPTQVATQPANDIRGFELPMSRVLPAGYLNSIIMDDGYVYKDNVIPLGSEGESVLYQTPMYRLLCGDEEVYDALESYLSDCKRGEDQFERIFDPNGDEKRQCGEHLIAMCNSNFSLLNLTEEQKDSVVNDLQKNIRTHAMFHRLLVTLAASVVMSTQIRTFRAVTTINAYADVLQLVTNDWKNLIDSLTRMMQETQNAANGIGEKIEKGRHLGELKALRNQLEGEKSYHNLMLKFNSCKDALNGLPPPNNKIHNKMLTAMQRRHAWYPQSIETKNMRVMLEQVDKILSNSVVVSDQADQVCEELVKLATLLDNALGVADFTDYLIHQEERKLELVDHLEVYRDKAEKEGAVLTKMRVESESLKAELTIIQDRYTKVDRELKTTNGTLKETRTNLKKAETKASKEEVRANNIQSSLNDSENRVKSLKKDIEILKKSSADEKNKAKKEKEKDQALIRQQSVDLAAREHERDKAKKELQDTIRAKEKIEKERKSLASQLATQTDRAKAAEVMILETRKKAARADLEEKLEEAKSGMAETNELLKRFRTVNDQETLNKSLSEWTTAVDKYSSFVKTVGYEYEGHINEIRTGAKTLAQIPEVKIPQYDLPKLFRPPPVQKVAPSSQASAPTPQPAAVATPPPPPPMIPQPAAGVIGQPRAMHAGRFGAPGAPSTTPVTSARRCAGSPTTGNAPSSTPTTSTPLKKSGTSTTNGVPTNETNGTSSSSSATPGGLASLTGGLWPWTSYDMFHPIASESSDSQFNSSLNSFHRNIWAANSESSFMSDLFGTSAERSASSPSAATPPAATPTAAAPAPPPPPPPSAPSTPSAGTFLSALAAQHQQFNPAPGQPVGRPQNQQQQQDQPSMIGSMTSSQQQHQQVQQQQQQQQHQQHHRLLQQQQQQQQQHVAHHMQQQQSSSSGPPPGHHHLQQHQPRYGDLWALQQPPHSQQQQNQVHNTLSGLNLPNPIQPPNNHTHQTQQQQQQTLFQQMQLRQNSMNNASGDHARDNFANFQGGWKPQQSPHMSQQPRSNGYNHYNNNYD